MNRTGLQRWPLWQRILCRTCGRTVLPDATTSTRAYTCGCRIRYDAASLERHVLAACGVADTIRTAGLVRPYTLTANWLATPATRRATMLADLAAVITTDAGLAIEVLHLPSPHTHARKHLHRAASATATAIASGIGSATCGRTA